MRMNNQTFEILYETDSGRIDLTVLERILQREYPQFRCISITEIEYGKIDLIRKGIEDESRRI